MPAYASPTAASSARRRLGRATASSPRARAPTSCTSWAITASTFALAVCSPSSYPSNGRLPPADLFAGFDQQQQRLVVRRRDAQPPTFAHDRAVDGLDLGWPTALHVLEHGRLRWADVAAVLAY